MIEELFAEGDRIRVFHPYTFGTMEACTVLKIVSAYRAKVRFDRPTPNGRRVFTVSTEHVIKIRKD